MHEWKFNERDHLAWSRFMLLNLALSSLVNAGEEPGGVDDYVNSLRRRLSVAWAGLGAQGVEGAMLSMILTLESMGCAVRSTQTSPESSEIVVESLPGSEMIAGLRDRFDIGLDPQTWYDLFGSDEATANRIYDILGAIADGAGVEFLRETTGDGHVRLILRAW